VVATRQFGAPFSSGGGFSAIAGRSAWQADAVDAYLAGNTSSGALPPASAFTPTGRGPVEMTATVGAPATGNALAHIVVLPSRERLPPDGLSSAMLTVATLDEFAADALVGDMSITSPLRPTEPHNPDGATDDNREGVDASRDTVDLLADFVDTQEPHVHGAPSDELAAESGSCDTIPTINLPRTLSHPSARARSPPTLAPSPAIAPATCPSTINHHQPSPFLLPIGRHSDPDHQRHCCLCRRSTLRLHHPSPPPPRQPRSHPMVRDDPFLVGHQLPSRHRPPRFYTGTHRH
jgi:hypothetical protein